MAKGWMTRSATRALATVTACWFGLMTPSFAQTNRGDDEGALLSVLAVDPANGEARFRLGRLYYEQRRDRAADFQLRQARAQVLSEESAAAADDLLAGLQRRRRWILRGDLAVAPQTSRTITETIDDSTDAEPEQTSEVDSGVGIIANASLENRLPISSSMRFSTQVVGRALDYQGAQFDLMTVTALAGPLWLQEGDNLWSARPLAQRRWREGEVEFDAFGGELAMQRSVTDQVRAFARLNVRDVDFDTANERDGINASVDSTMTRYRESGGLERVFGSVFRAEAEVENQAFWFSRVGVGAYRETFAGVGVYLEPFVSLQEFDGIDDEAGIGRRNVGYGGRVRLVKQNWRALFNAAPYLQISARRIDSNIDGADTQDDANRVRLHPDILTNRKNKDADVPAWKTPASHALAPCLAQTYRPDTALEPRALHLV